MKLIALIAVALSFATTLAHAETVATPRFDISGGSNMSFSNSFIGDDMPDVRVFNIQTGVYYFVSQRLEIGGKLAFSVAHASGTTATSWEMLFGPTWNFNAADVANSAFVRAGVGFNVSWVDAGTSANFAYGASVGKRMELVHNVTWTPEVGVSGIAGTPMVLSLYVVPVQFSVLF